MVYRVPPVMPSTESYIRFEPSIKRAFGEEGRWKVICTAIYLATIILMGKLGSLGARRSELQSHRR